MRADPRKQLGSVGTGIAPGLRLKSRMFKEGPMHDIFLHTGFSGFYFGALWDKVRKSD